MSNGEQERLTTIRKLLEEQDVLYERLLQTHADRNVQNEREYRWEILCAELELTMKDALSYLRRQWCQSTE